MGQPEEGHLADVSTADEFSPRHREEEEDEESEVEEKQDAPDSFEAPVRSAFDPMDAAMLPVRNTFIDFDCRSPDIYETVLSRSSTCPHLSTTSGRPCAAGGCQGSVGEGEAPGGAAARELCPQSPDSKALLSPGASPARRGWADLSGPEASPRPGAAAEDGAGKASARWACPGRRRWADLSSPEASPRPGAAAVFAEDELGEVSMRCERVESSCSTSRLLPDEQDAEEAAGTLEETTDAPKRRWVDLISDDETEVTPAMGIAEEEAATVPGKTAEDHLSARALQATACGSQETPRQKTEETSDLQETARPHPKRRWADLVSDDECQDTIEAAAVAQAKQCTQAPAARRARPEFQKPTREARVRQLQGKIAEFCTLSFDDVDAAQQYGLTFRMLALLRSLAESLSFWEVDVKQDVEAYTLLGLEEEDMFIIGRAVRKATSLADNQRYRDAYNKLCSARAWFPADDPEAVQKKRSELRVAATERAAARQMKKARGEGQVELGEEGAAGEWTEVPARKLRRPEVQLPRKEDADPVWAKASQRLRRLGRQPQ